MHFIAVWRLEPDGRGRGRGTGGGRGVPDLRSLFSSRHPQARLHSEVEVMEKKCSKRSRRL